MIKIFDDELKFKIKLDLTDSSYKYLLRTQNLEKFAISLSSGLATASDSYLCWLQALGFNSKNLLALELIHNPIGWSIFNHVSGFILIYGEKTLIDNFDQKLSNKTPEFLNRPLDYLGQNLVNVILPMAIKIFSVDEKISEQDEKMIIKQFKNCGYNEKYIKEVIREILSFKCHLNIVNTKKKLKIICDKTPGLEYNILKFLVDEALQTPLNYDPQNKDAL